MRLWPRSHAASTCRLGPMQICAIARFARRESTSAPCDASWPSTNRPAIPSPASSHSTTRAHQRSVSASSGNGHQIQQPCLEQRDGGASGRSAVAGVRNQHPHVVERPTARSNDRDGLDAHSAHHPDQPIDQHVGPLVPIRPDSPLDEPWLFRVRLGPPHRSVRTATFHLWSVRRPTCGSADNGAGFGR